MLSARTKIIGMLKKLIADKNDLALPVTESMQVVINRTYKPEISAKLVDSMVKHQIEPHHHSIFWGDRMLSLDKSMGFLSDPAFNKAYHAIRGSHQYDQYDSPHTLSWRLHTLVWAAKCGMNVPGDFVECGVFKGDMSWVITQMVDLKSAQKQFYLYDTFAGFSEKYSSTADFPENPNFLSFAHQHYTEPGLYDNVCKRFANQPEVHVMRGVVPDILLEKVPEQIAYLHIDLNSPAAEIGALEILFPRLSAGAILIFDDYGWKQFHRQKEAEDVFMRNLGYQILELPTGQGMVVKR